MKRTVVFGGGYWGETYLHTLVGNVVLVVEPNKQRAEEIQKKFNVAISPDLPADLDYDAAIIATPPETHIQIAESVLKTGRSALIEKPLSMSVEEAMKIKQYKNVMCAHVYLYHPFILKLRDQIRTIPLDHCFSRRTNAGPVRRWQNALWDLGPHDISIFNYLFGTSPVSASATGEHAWAVARLSYYTVDAVIYVSWLGGPKVRRLEMVPAEESKRQERIIFDDVLESAALSVKPLTALVQDFLADSWDDRSSFRAGLDIVSTLEKCRW